MLIADYRVGRLVETVGSGPLTSQEFATFRSSFLEKMARVPGRVIAVGDLRHMDELAPDVAPMVLGMLRADNARIERAAHFVTAGSAFARQYQALIGDTRNPMRQVFTDQPALLTWMSEALDAAELARLRELLGR